MAALKNIIFEAEASTRGEIGPELKENLESIDWNIDRLTRIISDFNDISEIDSGKTKVVARPL